MFELTVIAAIASASYFIVRDSKKRSLEYYVDRSDGMIRSFY